MSQQHSPTAQLHQQELNSSNISCANGAGNSSSSSLNSSLLPGGVVTTQNISTVIKPKENNNSMQFVKIKPPDLSKKAVEQIRVAQESKITKDKLKEVEEEWQSNLLKWKSKRRQHFVGPNGSDDGNNEEQNNNELPDNNGRKVKTFAQMIEQRSRSNNRLNFNLQRYINSGDEDEGAEQRNGHINQQEIFNEHADGNQSALELTKMDCIKQPPTPEIKPELQDTRPLIAAGNTDTIEPSQALSETKMVREVDLSPPPPLPEKKSSQMSRPLIPEKIASPLKPPIVIEKQPDPPSLKPPPLPKKTSSTLKSPPAIEKLTRYPEPPAIHEKQTVASPLRPPPLPEKVAPPPKPPLRHRAPSPLAVTRSSETISPDRVRTQHQQPLPHTPLQSHPDSPRKQQQNHTQLPQTPQHQLPQQQKQLQSPQLQQNHHQPQAHHPINQPQQQQQQQDRTILSVSGKRRCSSCREELGRGAAAFVVESLNLVYHTNCFKCSVCHVDLSNGFRGVDVRVHAGALHCQNCYSKDGLNYSRV